MSQDDAKSITDGKVSKKARFDTRDWKVISDHVQDVLSSRKKARKDLEKHWDEIDRQVRMEPDDSHKRLSNGQLDANRLWMPETELPLQAQTKEMLTADARRMMFPSQGPWHEAHAALTDDYLDRADLSSIIAGDKAEVPSLITQDNADKLVSGVVDHWHRQYDFFGHIDQINAEAFSYGMGLGRARKVTKRLFHNTAKGVVPYSATIPVLVPTSIRNTYLDDSKHSLMNEGHMVGPSVVRTWFQSYADIAMAARKGSKDPENISGGWMPKNLAGVEGDKNGQVEVMEMEGDFVVPRATRESMFLPNCIVTVIRGESNKKKVSRVIRFRWWDQTFSSYVEFPYHYEVMDTAYPTSPLMKGRPIQAAATNALIRMMMAGELNAQPPIGYDSDDQQFASTGGPVIFPGAQWGTTGNLTVHQIGDPSSMFAIYAGLLQQYADVTGINAPRLGAQTVSHTTAFAKEAELTRGTIRTVDYVRATLKNSLTKWLYMAYEMGRADWKEQPLYIDAYQGWVEPEKKHLPDFAFFEVHGAGGPADEAANQQQRLQAMQLALQMDQLAIQAGGQPTIINNMRDVIQHVLRQGGWSDVDVLVGADQQPAQPAQPGQLPGILTEGIR